MQPNPTESRPDLSDDHPELGGSTVSIENGMINLNIRTASGEKPSSLEEGAAILEKVGHTYFERYQARGITQDVRIAVACYIQASNLTPESDPLKPSRVSNIGNAYLVRFARLEELDDLESAIKHHTQAVNLVLDASPHKPGMLANLGSSHLHRFERLDDLEDLNKAIEYHTEAYILLPDEHPFKSSLMSNLGRSLFARFERLESLDDLNMAMKYQVESVAVVPEDHPSRPTRLNNLGRSHLARFERTGDLGDLEEAIRCQTESIATATENHPEIPGRLKALASAFIARHKRLHDIEDLDLGIELNAQATELTPNQDANKPKLLNSSAITYRTRFEVSGNPEDLEQAIAILSQARSLCTKGHPDIPMLLNSTATSLHLQFKRYGNVASLDKAIKLGIQSVDLTPQDHPGRPGRLNNLGMSYCDRYQQFEESSDIGQAIQFHTEAVSLLPSQHSSLWKYLLNLGAALFIRFQQTPKAEDLELALDYHNQALSLMPPNHPNQHTLLNNIGLLHYERFRLGGKLEDVHTAIEFQIKAISLLDDKHSDISGWLNNLSMSYFALFESSADSEDIDRAITHQSRAVVVTPQDHILQSVLLHNLGKFYRARFHQVGNTADRDRALDSFERGTKAVAGSPLVRLRAALDWGRLAYETRLHTSRSAYNYAMYLFPRAVGLGVSVSNRYHHAEKLGHIGLEAATVAILYGDYETALEWMEESRSIVWRQMLRVQTPLDKLAVVNESLANEISKAAMNLGRLPGTTISQSDDQTSWRSLENSGQRHRQAEELWEELVSQAREIPGMEQFLLPKKASQLVQAAHSGAVVVIVVQMTQVSALIIPQGATQVLHLALPELSYEKLNVAQTRLVQSLQRQGRGDRGFRSARKDHNDEEKLLMMLWSDVVKPVIDLLGYTLPESQTALPRITWCTSGALNFLPLHAAGDYSVPNSTLFDYAISSYTPSLSFILSANPVPNVSSVLGVGQTSTPGFSDLPSTRAELERVQEQACGIPFTKLEGGDATTSAVLEAMSQHNWVHFACHGSQNLDQPTLSAFHLHDGPLTLAAITQKSISNARLAFLSACQTATGNQKIPDEAVHLAAGMIVAGYRTVVATMWSIEDADAPVIAGHFYAYMLEGGYKPEREPARALHFAVGRLRDQVGAKDVGRWASYIHVGM